MSNKKNILKVVFVLVIGFSLGVISINIIKAKLDGPVDVVVGEFISYQEIDYSLKKDNESMSEFELNQAKDFLYNEETIYTKQTRIKSLNLDICEGERNYSILDHNNKSETEYDSLDDLFEYLEEKSK